MCGSKDETVNHLLSKCSTQVEYKRRHDIATNGIHWDLCKQYGIDVSDKWYKHNP